MELDDYIQNVTMEYQSGENWIKITDETKDIPADARLKITVTYKDVRAKVLLEHNKTLKYHLPESVNCFLWFLSGVSLPEARCR